MVINYFQDFLINIKFNEQHVFAFIKYINQSLSCIMNKITNFSLFLNRIQMSSIIVYTKILSSKTF